jgi:hypothetical protein
MRTPESYEKEDIKKFLDTLGSDCWHYAPYMKGFGKNGVPDRVGCYKGRLFGIEVKRDINTKPTPIQERRMAEIRGAGGWAVAGPASHVIFAFRTEFCV